MDSRQLTMISSVCPQQLVATFSVPKYKMLFATFSTFDGILTFFFTGFLSSPQVISGTPSAQSSVQIVAHGYRV